ncbi:MAG: rhodanese-like domain-containing protein [Gammaproteobacteria bacterium]
MQPCTELRQALDNGAQLVDVRTPQEYASGALPGAINLPVQYVAGAHRHLDPQRPVLVYCRSGQRSEMARMILASLGFADVLNLGSYGDYHPCWSAHC